MISSGILQDVLILLLGVTSSKFLTEKLPLPIIFWNDYNVHTYSVARKVKIIFITTETNENQCRFPQYGFYYCSLPDVIDFSFDFFK